MIVMLKSYFLIVVWLVHVMADNSSSFQNSKDDSDLKAEFDRIADEILSSFTEAHSRPLHRRKREIVPDYKTSFIDETGVYRLQSVTPVSSLCYPAIDTKFLNIDGTTYAICASIETNESPAEVIVGIYKEHVWEPINRWYVSMPMGLSAFHFNGLIYVLVADKGKVKGTDLVKIDIASHTMSVDHTIHSKAATSNSIWKMNTDGKYNLAVANLAMHSTDFSSEVFIYEWTNTYFDLYTSIDSFDVKDIEPFHIHDTPYLAIANYRKSPSNFQADSEIFRYNLDKKDWISHQKIRTYGATDLEFFTLGSGITKDFFLAVANKEDDDEPKSMIYKFAKDIFVPFQCLPIYRASSIASWSTKYAFLMAVASIDDAVHLFQYDGWHFVLSRTQYTKGSMAYGVNALIFQNVTRGSEEVPILSVSNLENTRDSSVFEIGFKHENVLQDWTTKSTEWCFNTLQKVEATDTDSLIRALDDVLFIDQQSPVVVEGNLRFENGFEVSKLQTPQLKVIVTQEVYDSGMLLKLEDLNKRLQVLNEKFLFFEEVFNNSLKTKGDQVITGRMKFQDVVFDCETHNCQFDSITTTFLNGEDITNWSKNLVFLDSEYIDGTLMAENVTASNIDVFGSIDGVDSKTLVTKSGNHLITGHKTFENEIIANEIEVEGKVDGLTISPSTVLLSTGYQNITGNLVFEEIDTAWLEVTDLVNGVDLSSFFHDVVRSDQPAVITGEKVFHNVVVDDLKMAEGSTINGIDLNDLWKNVMWKDRDQTIKAPMTFNTMEFKKNLIVPQGINGINIPGPRVVDITGHASITAPQVFLNPVKMAHLEVLNSLNGLGMVSLGENIPQLDIMLKSGNQIISGRKTFHTIHLDGDSFVSGTVDGVDLSELKQIALQKDSPMTTNRTWVFNNLVIKGPLTVDKISGYDIDDLYENALKLTEIEMPNIVFNEVIHIESLTCYNISGININQDLVLVNEPQTITGTKTFNQVILHDNSIVTGAINNMDVTFLNETILRIGNQVLPSKVFNKNIKMNNLIVKGSINNVPVSEFVTLSDTEAIMHAVELKNVTFNEIEVQNLEVTGMVNGINIEEMMQDTLTYEGNQKMTGTLTVKGAINVAPGTDIKVGTINGVDITELWEDAVLVDEPQEIWGEKTFVQPIVFDDLKFKDTLDGVTEEDMKNWMLKDVPQTVYGDVTFINDLSVDDMKVNGLINGINITELSQSIVKINEPTVIEGPVIFHDTVTSLGDITLSGKIQGVDLSEEAVTKSGDKVMTGAKTFEQDLVIEEDLIVEGKVDGVSISDICDNTLTARKEQKITHLTIKGDVTLSGGATIGGKIAGLDLEQLNEIVALDDNSIVIDGHKSFENLTIEGPVTIEGLFGGIDLEELNSTYMSLTRDQTILEPMTFEDATFKGALAVDNFYSQDNLVNGINIKELDDRLLKIDGTQTVTAEHHFDEIIFNDDVFVAGQVNELDVPGGLMRRNKPNYIQSPKVFEKPVTILGNLDISPGKLIQGVDVSEWNRKAVLKEGSFEIYGHKTFNNLAVNDVKVEGLLDGLKISEDTLLMNYGDQVVTGQKTVKGDVDIQGSLTVNGLVNGVDLNYLSSNTLQKDKVNTVTGEKYFTKPVSIQSLEAPSVAGINVVELQKKINTNLDFELVQNRLDEIDGVMKNVKDSIDKQAVIFQYYELFQEFDLSRAYSWHYLSNLDSELLLLSDNSSSNYAEACTSIRIFQFSPEKQKFVPHPMELPASYATAVRHLDIGGEIFLFVGNRNPKAWCSNDRDPNSYAESDIYVWKNNEFQLFQKIFMDPVADLEVFTDGSLSCVVYVEISSATVYCSNGVDDEFKHIQTLPTKSSRKAAVIQAQGKTILALGAEDLRPRTFYYVDDKDVDVYFWDPHQSTFGAPVQSIPSKFIQSLLLVSHDSQYSSDLFLVIGAGRIPKVQEEPKISIYRYEEADTKFRRYQDINENGEVESINLITGELILFILDKMSGDIKLYEYKGASGFMHIDTVKSIGAVNLHAFVRRLDPEDSVNHYLALAGPHALVAQPAQGNAFAKILKSKVKGRRYFINP